MKHKSNHTQLPIWPDPAEETTRSLPTWPDSALCRLAHDLAAELDRRNLAPPATLPAPAGNREAAEDCLLECQRKAGITSETFRDEPGAAMPLFAFAPIV